ncbi:MAG: HlyD family efflux transporter periplasmic adaptor subunit, partial [Anaerolineaceae bacterium]|nr:HlyD family efflux transporter periplasmic adaptor subunit [Anaerolineaceae bacterium]
MIVVLLTVAAGSPLLTYRYLKAGAPPVEQPDAKTPSPTDIRISTSQPVWRTFSSRLPWIGVVEARASVSLTALVDGRVEAIEAGDQVPVEAGAVVMRLGGPRVESERARLEAGVKSLKSQLALADQTVARFQQSLAEHLATKDDLAAAKQIQLQLQGQVRHAQLALDSFEEQLRIIAPMAGVFTRRRASTGQAVQAGQVLGEIVDADHLRIVASLFPPAGVALEGKKATVRLDEGQLFTGQYQVMQRTIRDFVLVGLAAVVLIYLIMAMQFRSWAQPLIILVTIP